MYGSIACSSMHRSIWSICQSKPCLGRQENRMTDVITPLLGTKGWISDRGSQIGFDYFFLQQLYHMIRSFRYQSLSSISSLCLCLPIKRVFGNKSFNLYIFYETMIGDIWQTKKVEWSLETTVVCELTAWRFIFLLIPAQVQVNDANFHLFQSENVTPTGLCADAFHLFFDLPLRLLQSPSDTETHFLSLLYIYIYTCT